MGEYSISSLIVNTSKTRSIPTCFDSSFCLPSLDKLYHSHLEDQIMEALTTVEVTILVDLYVLTIQVEVTTVEVTILVEVTTVAVTILADLCDQTIQGEVSFPELEAMGTGMEMLEMVMGIIMLEAIMATTTLVITMAMEIQEDMAMENNDKLLLNVK